MARSSFVDRDKGYQRIIGDLRALKGSHTKVGIQQGSNLGSRNLGEMVTIGAVHEFGSPNRNIPVRSYMRTTFDDNIRQVNNLKRRLYDSVVRGRLTTKQALAILGEFVTTKIKKKITDLKFPPLKNPSEKRTGGGIANPLVDTGQLRASITHIEVVK